MAHVGEQVNSELALVADSAAARPMDARPLLCKGVIGRGDFAWVRRQPAIKG